MKRIGPLKMKHASFAAILLVSSVIGMQGCSAGSTAVSDAPYGRAA